MKFFNIFKKKQKLSVEDQKWNKMWELWVNEEIPSPYFELMLYSSEVNNGGHYQFFDNVSSSYDINKANKCLEDILPKNLKQNLLTAYNVYIKLENGEKDENLEEIIDNCDNIFYKNENDIDSILKQFSLTIELN